MRLLDTEAEQPLGQRGQRESGEHEQSCPPIPVYQRVRNDIEQDESADGDQHEAIDEGQHLRARLRRAGNQRSGSETRHAGEQQGMAQNDDAVRPLVSRNDREYDMPVR